MKKQYAAVDGTEGENTLSYSSIYDKKTDTTTYYTTLNGLGGNDTFLVGSEDSPPLTIIGGDGDDSVEMEMGSTTTVSVDGGAGDDLVQVRIGSDNADSVVDGGEGFDTLVLYGTFRANRLKSFEALKLDLSTTISNRDLHRFEAVYTGAAILKMKDQTDLAGVNFVNTSGQQTIWGSDEDDRLDLTGININASINANYGADVIIAGGGRLSAWGGYGADFIQGGTGDDYLSNGGVRWYGSDLSETVLGMAGNDIVEYNWAKGVFDGGEGKDTLQLRLGEIKRDLTEISITNFETLNLSTSNSATISVNTAFFQQFDHINGSGDIFFTEAVTLDDLPTLARHIDIHGSDRADTIDLKSSEQQLSLFLGDGNDRVIGYFSALDLDGEDGNDYLVGSSVRDTISGGKGDDTIVAGAGDDVIRVFEGADIVDAGDGADLLNIDTKQLQNGVKIDFGDGDDVAKLAAGHGKGGGTIDGGAGKDLVRATGDLSSFDFTGVEVLSVVKSTTGDADTFDSFDRIETSLVYDIGRYFRINLSEGGELTWKRASTGNQGLLRGSEDADILDFANSKFRWSYDLAGGNDSLIGTDLGERMLGGDGEDSISGQNGKDSIYGQNGDDHLTGGDGGDFLLGGSGNDILEGGDHWDNIFGGAGDDVLKGGPDGDNLYGEEGSDRFIFTPASEGDTVRDFQTDGPERDIIELSGFGAFNAFGDLNGRIKQNNDHTMIVLDAIVSAYPMHWENVLILKNVTARDLSAEHFTFS
ncbi:calcium-binding protein [Rhizobium sp. FKL33]|uniref:calcium-binding protein n=1 Tax=Rhizobium sp. FKL33 TaxID=2562307 RepID=UPI0010BF7A37|nr:calcium-binding protein [Rhizobium sp. FKL33]